MTLKVGCKYCNARIDWDKPNKTWFTIDTHKSEFCPNSASYNHHPQWLPAEPKITKKPKSLLAKPTVGQSEHQPKVMKRLNGWQMNNLKMQRHEIVPAVPTRWELFCCANKIEDPLLALKNGKRKLILEWVHKHHDNAFIPENILEEIGCTSRWEN